MFLNNNNNVLILKRGGNVEVMSCDERLLIPSNKVDNIILNDAQNYFLPRNAASDEVLGPTADVNDRVSAIRIETVRTDKYVYKGGLSDGLFDGHGQISYVTARPNQTVVYQGYWKNGLKHGYGRQVVSEVGIYEGNFSAGLRTGFGELKYDPLKT